MRRVACPLDAASRLDDDLSGAILLVDILQVKQGRSALSIYGALYGGPNFNEPEPASASLHLEEFFYSDTCAELETDSNGDLLPKEVSFDRGARGAAAKWCSHVDFADEGVRGAMHLLSLRPATGIGSYRDPDGFGVIGGYAARGGAIVVDGLVTAPDRWMRAHHLKKRRFRFVGDGAIDSSGDVRAFLLVPSPSQNRSALPHLSMRTCTSELGCPLIDAPVACWCVSICVGTRLQWAAVVDGKLKAVQVVGTCARQEQPPHPTIESLNSTLVEHVRQIALPAPPSPPLPIEPTPPALSAAGGGVKYGVSYEMRANSNVDDYTDGVQAEMREKLAQAANVDAGTVSLAIAAGSVVITVTFDLGSQAQAESFVSAMGGLNAASLNLILDGIQLADGTSLTVESVSAAEVVVLSDDSGGDASCGGGCIGGIIGGCAVPILLCILWLSGAFGSKFRSPLKLNNNKVCTTEPVRQPRSVLA